MRLDAIPELVARWNLSISSAFHSETSWVAPAVGANGDRVVLKLGAPQMEAAHEIDGLRFWNGDPTVRLIEADDALNAMLIERCEPGTALRELPEEEQDVVIAQLLRRLWRKPPAPHRFRPLSEMIAYWSRETLVDSERWPDAGLVRAGLRALEELAAPSPDDVLLATDLHAENVLSAQREPWLVIDPKPFIGDRAYDATQHLLNCQSRMSADPLGTIQRFAGLLEVDHQRVRKWMFARAAAAPLDTWTGDSLALARALA